MKTEPSCRGGALPSLFIILFFAFPQKNFAQSFKSGVPASSFSATPADQSAILKWASDSFPRPANAGYLIIYSTSEPTLVSEPDGLDLSHAVVNGTIVQTNATALPVEPAQTATAVGLTNGITYYFLIVAYTWDGISTSTYQYSQPTIICTTLPPDGPRNLNLPYDSVTAVSVAGSFAKPLFPADGYIVAYSTDSATPVPANGHAYAQSESFGFDTVAEMSRLTSFNAPGLAPLTTYYFFVFSYSISRCDSSPVYSNLFTTNNITTLATSKTAIAMNDYSGQTIRLMQNPVPDDIALQVNSSINDKLDIVIFSLDGREIKRKTIQVQQGTSTIHLHTAKLAQSMYFIRGMFGSGRNSVLPFIKQ